MAERQDWESKNVLVLDLEYLYNTIKCISILFFTKASSYSWEGLVLSEWDIISLVYNEY